MNETDRLKQLRDEIATIALWGHCTNPANASKACEIIHAAANRGFVALAAEEQAALGHFWRDPPP